MAKLKVSLKAEKEQLSVKAQENLREVWACWECWNLFVIVFP